MLPRVGGIVEGGASPICDSIGSWCRLLTLLGSWPRADPCTSAPPARASSTGTSNRGRRFCSTITRGRCVHGPFGACAVVADRMMR